MTRLSRCSFLRKVQCIPLSWTPHWGPNSLFWEAGFKIRLGTGEKNCCLWTLQGSVSIYCGLRKYRQNYLRLRILAFKWLEMTTWQDMQTWASNWEAWFGFPDSEVLVSVEVSLWEARGPLLKFLVFRAVLHTSGSAGPADFRVIWE